MRKRENGAKTRQQPKITKGADEDEDKHGEAVQVLQSEGHVVLVLGQ